MWIALAVHFDESCTELGWSFCYQEAELIGWNNISVLQKPIKKLKIKWDGNRGLQYSLALYDEKQKKQQSLKGQKQKKRQTKKILKN